MVHTTQIQDHETIKEIRLEENGSIQNYQEGGDEQL